MDGNTTVKYLQNYIKAKDCHPELLKDYMLKLSGRKYPSDAVFESGR